MARRAPTPSIFPVSSPQGQPFRPLESPKPSLPRSKPDPQERIRVRDSWRNTAAFLPRRASLSPTPSPVGRAPAHLGRRPGLAAGGRTVHARQRRACAGSRSRRRPHWRGRFCGPPPQGSGPVTLSSVSEVPPHERLGLRGLRSRRRQPQCAGVGAVPHVCRPAALHPSRRRPGNHLPGPRLLRSYRFGHRAPSRTSPPYRCRTTANSWAIAKHGCRLCRPNSSLEATPIRITAVAAGGAMTSPAGTFKVHNTGSGNID